jgi:ATP-dependent RNA helicase DeaD
VIEKLTRSKLEEITLPTLSDVAAARATKALAKAAARAEAGGLTRYRTAIEAFLAENPMSAADLAAALAAVVAADSGSSAPQPEHLLEPAERRASRDSSRPERGSRNPRGERNDRSVRPTADRAGRGTNGTGRRYRLAVGHRDGVRPAGIVGAITGEGGLTGRDLGRIDIFDTHSIVEINAELTPDAFSRISAARVSGRELKLRRHYEN